MPGKFSIPCFAALRPDASAREKILAAASDLLLTEGFSALTQQAVAARAGVRQSHLTYYFPTRNDLLRATAQYGVETMLLGPLATDSAEGELTAESFRQRLMPEKSDRQWFRLMTGLMIASEEDETIRPWLQEFDARIREKLAEGFAAVGVAITAEHLHLLHCSFIGALHLDMQEQSDASFERVSRTMELALNAVFPASVNASASRRTAPERATLSAAATRAVAPPLSHPPSRKSAP